MTDKDLNLTLATLTFLVQSLVRLQTKRTRDEMNLQIQSAFLEKKVPLYHGVTVEELQASVDSFLDALK